MTGVKRTCLKVSKSSSPRRCMSMPTSSHEGHPTAGGGIIKKQKNKPKQNTKNQNRDLFPSMKEAAD